MESVNQQGANIENSTPQRCEQCGAPLTEENRHISGLMCVDCALPVEDESRVMTEDELKAIEARAAAATPGPWTTGVGKVANGETRELVIGPNDDVIVAIAYGGFGNPVDRTTEDRKFIAHAREDVPALVAAVRRLRGALKDALMTLSPSIADKILDDHGIEYAKNTTGLWSEMK